MANESIEIVPCPASLSVEALALVLRELTPAQRRGTIPPNAGQSHEALIVALDGAKLVGAAWGQRQPGSTAILWLPHLVAGTGEVIADRLNCAVAAALDDAGIRMTQALVTDRQSSAAKSLQSAGFTYLADLLYLSWEAAHAPAQAASEVAFEPYCEAAHDRFVELIEQTYEATQDCAALNGRRPMNETIDGYRATGVFRPENWLFVRHGAKDVGVLLLADHGTSEHWELVYMGLVTAARGKRIGAAIVRHAQQLVHGAGVARLLLAVDAANSPAIKMYNESGFIAWDTRIVYVLFAPANSALQKAT
jgi:GNAT superfamily N-acetyltransferase